MKKSTFKRMGFALLQHILAAGLLLAVAGLLLNSHVVRLRQEKSGRTRAAGSLPFMSWTISSNGGNPA